jgi:hypothetical protein
MPGSRLAIRSRVNRLLKSLNVPNPVRLGFSLAAAAAWKDASRRVGGWEGENNDLLNSQHLLAPPGLHLRA